MRNYEITAILAEGGSIVEETKNAIKDILKKYSAEVTSEDDWGSKRLWHKSMGKEQGHFTLIGCKAEPSVVSKIEHELLLNQNIIRSLIIKGK